MAAQLPLGDRGARGPCGDPSEKNIQLNAGDVAAGTLLVREAGGAVTRADGSPPALDARSILATNGRIHTELAAALAPAPAP